jgi:ribosomal protein L29
MAAKRTKTVHDQSITELSERLIQLDRELFALRNEKAMQRKLEKPHLLPMKRKEKARVLTILTQKQRAL